MQDEVIIPGPDQVAHPPEPDPVAHLRGSGPSGYSIVGWLMLLVGLVIAGISFALPTSVNPDSIEAVTARLNALTGGYSPPPMAISNLSLLQQQMIVLNCGIGLAVMGAVFISAGAILNAIEGRK